MIKLGLSIFEDESAGVDDDLPPLDESEPLVGGEANRMEDVD
jgi:hypothetical protein